MKHFSRFETVKTAETEVKFMPIAIAPIGKKLKIKKVLTDEKTKKHLESLGLTIDSELSIVAQSGGSLILMVKGGRLALDKVLATRILVA